MNGIILRIFSGMHLGAEIELNDGASVIGSDDSCDIILSDPSLAGRHAVLHVSTAGGEPSLEAEALDGSVLLDGTPIEGRSPIEQEHPFQLASVFFAWAAEGSNAAQAWAKAEAALAERSRPEPTPASASAGMDGAAGSAPTGQGQDEQPEEVTLTEKAREDSAADTASGQTQEPAEKETKPGPSTLSRLIKWAVLPAALCLLGLLCFSIKPAPDAGERVEKTRILLRENGHDKLEVSERLNGVAISGRIASDKERAAVLKLAQRLDFPVYLNLTVHSDMAEAVRASYNAMALYPDVTEDPAPNPCIVVRGYIRDAVLEEQALDAARHNVPALARDKSAHGAALEVHSFIRHMEDIQALLEPALAARRLRSAVSVDYLPGRVLIRGALTPKTREALREIAGGIQQKLDIPIPFDIINTAQAAAPEETPAQSPGSTLQQTSPQSTPASPRMGFKVTSVSMGPMKYLILEGGERVFEGAELPGGYILKGIGVNELILIKNNAKTVYPLRGGTD